MQINSSQLVGHNLKISCRSVLRGSWRVQLILHIAEASEHTDGQNLFRMFFFFLFQMGFLLYFSFLVLEAQNSTQNHFHGQQAEGLMQ